MLLHVPHSYRDRAEPRKLAELRIGEEATVEVDVRSARVRPTRRRGLVIVEATVADDSGPAKAVWFNQAWLVDRLTEGTRLLLFGKLDRSGFRVEAHEVLGAGRPRPPGIHTTGIVPVHPASERLRAQRLREWAWQARPLARYAIEPLPAELRARRGLASAGGRARPRPISRRASTRRRRRAGASPSRSCSCIRSRSRRAAPQRRARASRASRSTGPGELDERWLASLPFELTGDQRRGDRRDRRRPRRRAADAAPADGGGGIGQDGARALRDAARGRGRLPGGARWRRPRRWPSSTPRRSTRLLATESVPFTLLTSATPAARRREALGQLASGELAMVVGTHALIEPDVEFGRLAVCVVDEQHRFGVRQRAALDGKGPGGSAPHALHMTATPIPRTLSLTAYGDLDATVLRELPAGRKPVDTWVVGEEKRAGAYEFIRDRLREGRQAYVVCPLVEGSESTGGEGGHRGGGAAARDASSPTSRSGSCTARCRPREKQAAMERFASRAHGRARGDQRDRGGIDVANATVMLIEGAERYGLSQLHQLRGRVGRGEHRLALHPVRRRRLGARAAPPGGDRHGARRLQARGGRPGAARRGGDPRNAPARPAAVPGRGAPRRRRHAHRGAPRGDRAARSPRIARRARARAAARRRRGAASATRRSRLEGRRRRAGGPPARDPAASLGGGAADRRPRPRGALLDPRATSEGATVLDLFCGTGALAIEARLAGRRAAPRWSTRTPRWRAATSRELGLGDRCEVVRSDARAYLRRARRAFDLIFCDPPYRLADRLEGELDSLIGSRLAPGGRLIVEGSVRPAAAPRPAARARSGATATPSIRIHAGGGAMSNGRIAVCPGTYDPVTNGHLDIIGRAARVFDRVVVGVVNQPVRKQTTLFTRRGAQGVHRGRAWPERARQRRGGRVLEPRWSSSRASTAPAAIVKGLRAISDFEYEFEMNQLNRKLAPGHRVGLHHRLARLQLPLLDRREGDGDLRRRRLRPGARVAWRSALAERLKR